MESRNVPALGGRSFMQRMVAAAKLDSSLYNEVEADGSATGQAAGVVAIVAVSSAIGGVAGGGATMVGGLFAAFFGWLLWAGVTYIVGDKLLGGTATWGELLRTLGFAQSAGVFYVLGIIPVLGSLVRLVLMLWILLAGIVAIREALDFSTGKAVLTAVIGWLALLILTAIFALPAALVG